MVKAPRSKGCRVCVQRRVKCDQAKPFCMRCQRANRQCPGYETTKFVDEGPSIRALYEGPEDTIPQATGPPSSASSSQDGSPPPAIDPELLSRKSKSRSRTPPKAKGRVLSPANSENWYSGNFERGMMMCFMCPSTYQDQLLSNLIDSVRHPTLSPTFRCHSIWLREIAARPDPSKALVWSIRALSISNIGRRCDDPNLIETSRRVYGKALVKLNEAIQHPEEGYSSDTLSATILLSLYEIINCTDTCSWIKHAGGAGQLIRQRGPERHRHGFGRLVLIACRYLVIMEAFQTRVPCFLAQPEWRALCWEIHNSLDLSAPMVDANEHFFQLIAGLPVFIAAVYNALTARETSQQELERLITTGQENRTKLQKNHNNVVQELRAKNSEPIKTASSYNDTVFPVVYEFCDIGVASLYCGYWCLSISMNIAIVGLQAKLARLYDFLDTSNQQALASVVFSPNGSTQLVPKQAARPIWNAAQSIGGHHTYYQENRASAHEICKAAEWIQQAPFVGPLFLVVALRMSLRMDLPRVEKQFIIRKLSEIGENMELARVELETFMSEENSPISGRVGGGGTGGSGASHGHVWDASVSSASPATRNRIAVEMQTALDRAQEQQQQQQQADLEVANTLPYFSDDATATIPAFVGAASASDISTELLPVTSRQQQWPTTTGA